MRNEIVMLERDRREATIKFGNEHKVIEEKR